jgi:REP element-mobilizing transposase RayT
MIHAVWGTKNRAPFLTHDIRRQVIAHIKANAREKRLYIDTLDGYIDHLHCLYGSNADMSISKTLQLMKGEPAHWINKEKVTKLHFEWADEYFAVSVSESMIPAVRAYIRNQEEHHKKKTFKEEYDQFIKKYNLGSQG